MTANISPKIMPVNVSEEFNDTVDISGLLKGSELAIGTPLVVEVNVTGLTITNKAVNTAEQSVDGRTVAIGHGIDFTLSNFVTGRLYTLKITFSTNATQAATRIGFVKYQA